MLPDRDIVGWDIGGANLKLAWLGADGRLKRVDEYATPLWQGLEHLDRALDEAARVIPLHNCLHCITMTGELADLFNDRAEGVAALTERFVARLRQDGLRVYAGTLGFVDPVQVADCHAQVASANWLATASLLARHVGSGLLVDIGSTTSDVLLLQDDEVANQGYSDRERLACDELVYSGVVRTPLMAISQRAPWQGQWLSLANEHFATCADIYRLLGVLPEHADLHDSADGRGKSLDESRVRLARMIGADVNDGTQRDWRRLAAYFADRQLDTLVAAGQRQLSRGLDENALLIGAGVGRFVAERLAERLGMGYQDMDQVMDWRPAIGHTGADCAPAIAVAELGRIELLSCVC